MTPRERKVRREDHVRLKIRTEACEEIIEGSERCGLPAELRGQRSVYRDGRAYGEDGDAEVVELLPPVFPGDRGERFRVLQRVLDIVIRYMHVGWFLVDHPIPVFGIILGRRARHVQ